MGLSGGGRGSGSSAARSAGGYGTRGRGQLWEQPLVPGGQRALLHSPLGPTFTPQTHWPPMGPGTKSPDVVFSGRASLRQRPAFASPVLRQTRARDLGQGRGVDSSRGRAPSKGAGLREVTLYRRTGPAPKDLETRA